ncbi:MAG: type II secretion system protein GspD [Candidatus Omnitrophica bacterium]|nr:type II secretion system protein GspD [Candidatus Omnitrophota bacterium]
MDKRKVIIGLVCIVAIQWVGAALCRAQADEPPAVPENVYQEPVQEEPIPQETIASAIPAQVVIGEKQVLDVLDLKNMDILDVLKLISQKSGLNIIAGDNVKGRVTVFLKNIGVLDALKIIVEAYGWAYVKDGDIFKVMTAQDYEARYDRKFGQETETRIKQLLFAKATDVVVILNELKGKSGKIIPDDKSGTVILIDEPRKLEAMEAVLKKIDVPVETRVFDLGYAKAEEISTKVGEVLTPSVGSMKFDARSNKIVVSDTAQALVKIRKMIEAFDEKDKQVLIEAKIIQITLNNEHKMGVDWEAIVRDYHSLDLTGNFSILSSTDKHGRLGIGTLATDDYTALIEALDTVGTTNILSSPRITAINNKEAKILVGSTEPYVTTTTTTPSSGPTTTAESVNFIEVGVKLYVTPTIHQDGFVTMKIKPEVSSVTSNITTSNNNTIPVVETSEAETTVSVKDGVSIIIGGLIKEEKIKTTKKVPIFGDIPVMGLAFRSQSDEMTKTEIVIFLTPTIVSGDVGQKEDLAKAPAR